MCNVSGYIRSGWNSIGITCLGKRVWSRTYKFIKDKIFYKWLTIIITININTEYWRNFVCWFSSEGFPNVSSEFWLTSTILAMTVIDFFRAMKQSRLRIETVRDFNVQSRIFACVSIFVFLHRSFSQWIIANVLYTYKNHFKYRKSVLFPI